MATTSLKGISNEDIDKPVTEAPAEVKETTTHELAQSVPAASGIEGEVNNRDIQLPRINVVQKTSDLVNSGFTPGSLVYNKEIALGSKVRCVVTHIKKQYQQDLEYGSEVMPMVCDTIAEVREAGGTTEWGGENHFSEIAHMQLLIEAPEDLHEDQLDLFPYEADGKHWAPALFTVAKTAYKTAAKPVITAGYGPLRATGLPTGLWNLETDLKKNPRGSWHVPVMKLTGRTSGELAQLVNGLLG